MITQGLITSYLSNIVQISQMDGKLAPEEQGAIGEICSRLGAKENDLIEAIKNVGLGGYTMTPVGRFSDKIKNLEDMLFVAMVDGDLSKAEKDEMLVFVKKIDITKDQIRILLNETKAKINLQKITRKCRACAEPLTPDSKFCTSCGTDVRG